MNILMIHPYIWRDEYACHHCKALPPFFSNDYPDMAIKELFESFAKIREAYGKPIIISSGYRCPSHNIAVGGSYLSAHLFGTAFDLKFSTADDFERVFQIIEETTPNLRVGRYTERHQIHLDTAYLIEPKASESWREGIRWTLKE